MVFVSKGNFLKVSGGTTKAKDDKPAQSYYVVSLLDENKDNYKFFVFQGSDLYKKLQTNQFQFLQEVVISISVSNYNNVASLINLDLPNGK